MQSDTGLDALDMKLNQVLNGKVVRKDLVRKVEVGAKSRFSCSNSCSANIVLHPMT